MPIPPKLVGREIERYWTTEPPDLSARCRYWIRRIEKGWRGNRRFIRMGYDEAAEYLGVYIWEWLNVLSPLLDLKRRTTPCLDGPASSDESSATNSDGDLLASTSQASESGSPPTSTRSPADT